MPVDMAYVVMDIAFQKTQNWLLKRCMKLHAKNVKMSSTLAKTNLVHSKENFTKLCQDNVTAGGESLWEIPFSAGRGRVLYTLGVKHNAKDQYTGQAQGGVNGPTPTLYYDYDTEDVRRDITCVPYEWGKDLDSKGKASVQLRSINKWCFGKLRYEWMNRIVTSTNDDGINWQYMRLADVYLMAAEAENALGNTAKHGPIWNPFLHEYFLLPR